MLGSGILLLFRLLFLAACMAKYVRPLVSLAESQVEKQDIPSGIDVAMPVLWSLRVLFVLAIRTLLNTVNLHALGVSSIVALGGEDRVKLVVATAALLARVWLTH